MALHNTSIKIPRIEIERRRIGKNVLVQLGQKDQTISVEVNHYRGKDFLLKDEKDRSIFLKLPRSSIRQQETPYVLRIKDNIPDTGEENVITYIAKRTDNSLKPYTWYMGQVIAGAKEHKLPPDYIAKLEQVEAIEDPNPELHDT